MGQFGRSQRRQRQSARPNPRQQHRPPSRRQGGTGALFDPNAALSGRKLRRASNALTRIEIRPAVQSYLRQEKDLRAQQTGAEQGLYGLGQATSAAVGGAYNTLAGESAQTSARQEALQNLLNENTAKVNEQSQANLSTAQQGELGGLTEALKSRNVEPGGSAAQQALAKQVEAQQNAAAERAKGYGAFAQAQGAAFTGLANAQGQAEQMRGREAQSAISQAIADRIAGSNADYGSQIAEARGKRADAKALWGPTKLKNLLQLRGSERDFMNAKAATGAKNAYNSAIVKVAQLGVKGKKVSGKAQVKASGNYSKPKKVTVTNKYPGKHKKKK